MQRDRKVPEVQRDGRELWSLRADAADLLALQGQEGLHHVQRHGPVTGHCYSAGAGASSPDHHR
jgi:hypothetical protein